MSTVAKTISMPMEVYLRGKAQAELQKRKFSNYVTTLIDRDAEKAKEAKGEARVGKRVPVAG